MADAVEFSRNYTDHSTDQGFQFEFFCDRCQNGFRTRFKPFSLGMVSGALDIASGLLGGLIGQAANVSGQVSSAQRERAREEAYMDAVQELKPHFVQCPHCLSWVCRKNCWNEKRGICKSCAPDLGVERSAAQAYVTKEKVWEAATVSDEDKKEIEGDWSQTLQATCPKCGSPQATNAKFCPECGEKLKTAAFCPECGSKLQPNAKFCGDCGHKIG